MVRTGREEGRDGGKGTASNRKNRERERQGHTVRGYVRSAEGRGGKGVEEEMKGGSL